MNAEIPSVHAIYRYPVKGLSPEALTRTRLAVCETLPADRLYAIENGPSGFDPAAPRYQPKQRYLMLMRNERLARLRSRFEDANHMLAIELDGREAARGDLHTSDGRATIERFFADFCADELRGAPRVLHAPARRATLTIATARRRRTAFDATGRLAGSPDGLQERFLPQHRSL